ncbi:MAG: TonB-dependent receptor, partial [Bacteroidales bacterium]|nr:TonB-dependent receptor [Bacteroidales bacterium]
FMQSFALDSYTQNSKISLSVEKMKLDDLILQIESQTKYRFAYNRNELDVDENYSVNIHEAEIEEVLNQIFANKDINYMILERQIVLSPSKSISVIQQSVSVSGRVTDSSGTSLPGVTVVVKGTTSGTITDVNGDYSLSNVPANAVLQFSFVGMKTQEVAVAGKSQINITMQDESLGLDEVVVIGYGSVRKSDLTGSVTKVDVETLSDLSNVSVIQSLQGSVPGLNVGAVTVPGENPALSIRGQNSLSGSGADNAPLLVVDGSIYRGNIIDINPDDIESIDILKDASSAAIYGSQASNGVIIVTTKKGLEVGKPVISYSGSYSIETPSKDLTPMKSSELDGFFRDASWLDSRLGPDYLQNNPDFVLTQFLKTNDIVEGYNNGLDEDWWGGLTRNGAIESHNVSIRGKTNDFGYFFSGGYTDVEGFVINDDYKRFSTRINLDAEINSWLKVGLESFLTSSDYSGFSPSVENAFFLQPWAPIRNETGELVLFPEGSLLNPYAQLEIDDSDKRLNIFGNIHAEIKLPLNGLSYKINYSQNYQTSNHDQYNPYGATLTGYGFKNSSIGNDWTSDNLVSYIRSFNNLHNVNATFVYGVEKRTGSNTNASAQNFVKGDLGYNQLEAGDPALNLISTGAWEETSVYSMGRVIYNFNNRYLATATVRRDGFSGFGKNKKIGYFPSFALGWVASEESLVKNSLPWLEYLKLRGSYGSVGRRAVSRYETLAVLNSSPSYIFGEGGTTTIGQWVSSMANNDLGWETTTGFNFGVDFSFLNSRIHGNFEYYNNNTRDILYNIQLPEMNGFNSITTNIGQVHNYGIEFSLTGEWFKSKDFNWESTLSFSRNRNEIVSILGFDNDGDGVEDDLVANQLFIGEPQQLIYDYEIEGMWQFSDETNGVLPDGFYPGTYKIRDLNEDGAYSASDDKKIIGYKDPSYRLGLANRINYKQFSLYLFINSIQGGKDFYYGDDSPYSSSLWSKVDQLHYLNVPAGGWDYWMPENPDAKYRRLDVPAAYDARPYSQRNFVRLQDISLSYTFKKLWLSSLDISRLKVFVSGKNLLTLTKWNGWDPETGAGFAPGMPVMKNFTMGVNVEF